MDDLTLQGRTKVDLTGKCRPLISFGESRDKKAKKEKNSEKRDEERNGGILKDERC